MRIALLSPFAGIEQHVFRESIILKSFKEHGHQIYYISCDKAFEQFCMTQRVHGLNFKSSIADKKRICTLCVSNRNFINKLLKLDGSYKISRERNSIYLEHQNDFDNVNNINWVDFKVNGFDLGRMAFYEFALEHKINQLKFPESLIPQYKSHLASTIIAYQNAEEILSEIKPDALFMYNSRYSVNNIFAKVAESHGAKYYTLNASGHWDEYYRRFTMFCSEDEAFALSKSSEWEFFKSIKLSENEIFDVFKYLSSVVFQKNNWVYSESSKLRDPFKLRSVFGIEKSQKVVLVTLSSEDELIALEESRVLSFKVNYNANLTFKNLEEWLTSIFDIATRNTSIFFIIRPHPRDFPGRVAGSIKSDQANFLDNFLSKMQLPKNCYINYPAELVSIYDIMQITDLLLNQSSSIGADFASFGIPVLHNNPEILFAYPNELGYNLNSYLNYENLIHLLLSNDLDSERQILAFRWIYFRFFRCPFPVQNSSETLINRLKFYCLINSNLLSLFLKRFLILYERVGRNSITPANSHFVKCVELSLKGTHELAKLDYNCYRAEQDSINSERLIPTLLTEFINGRLPERK
jgi:hypothetical protein